MWKCEKNEANHLVENLQTITNVTKLLSIEKWNQIKQILQTYQNAKMLSTLIKCEKNEGKLSIFQNNDISLI